MINIEYEALSQMSNETLLQELAWRMENCSKYELLFDKWNSFKGLDGEDFAVKIEKRGKR